MKKSFFTLILTLLVAFLSPNLANAVEINVGGHDGAGNYYIPMGNYYRYSMTQAIYPGDEIIGIDGQLNAISFQCKTPYAITFSSLKIYLGFVDRTKFTSGSDWVPASDLTLVYDHSNVTVGSTAGWERYEFDTPFDYEGGRNLVVCVCKQQSSYSSTLQYCQMSSTAASIYRQSDSYTNYADPNDATGGTLYAQRNQIVLDFSTEGGANLVLTPEPLDLGARANNCYNREVKATLTNMGAPCNVNYMDVENPYFGFYGEQLPVMLSFEEATNFMATTVGQGQGEMYGSYVFEYSDGRTAATFPVTAYAYEPVSPDVWELARNVNSFPYSETFTPASQNLYDNYDLPGDKEDGEDVVFKLTFDHDVLLNADVEGTNGKIALYNTDFGGQGGPGEENFYAGTYGDNTKEFIYAIGKGGPNDEANMLARFEPSDPLGTMEYIGVVTAPNTLYGGVKIGDEIYATGQSGVNALLKYNMNNLGAYTTLASGVNCLAMAQDPVSGTVYLVNNSSYLQDVNLQTGAIGGNVNVYVGYKFGAGIAFTDEGRLFGIHTSSYTSTFSEINVQTGAVTDLFNLPDFETTGSMRGLIWSKKNQVFYGSAAGSGVNSRQFFVIDPNEGFTTTTYVPDRWFEFLSLELVDMSSRDDVVNAGGDYPISGLTLNAGSYYLAASSTADSFTVNINPETLPCAEQTTAVAPLDDEDGVQPAAVNLEWQLGNYTTEYRLVFGSTYYCEETLVDWTTDLATSYTVTDLFNNTNYFWRVDVRNSECETLGQVWGFTTTFNAPTNLHATNTNGVNIYEGEALNLAWTAIQDRTFRQYNIYQNGELIGSTPLNSNTTTYTVNGLDYDMYGYMFYVTAVYDEGESDPSNELYVHVSGNGRVAGHVYEQDGVTGIAGATVTFNGTDEFGRTRSYDFITDATGAYGGDILSGEYSGKAECNGYQPVNAPVCGNPVDFTYAQTTSPVDFVMNEVYTPVGEVIAEYYPDPEDPESPYVKVYWGWNIMSAMIEDFETGDFSQYDWNIPAQYPFEITTNNPYEGAYCMQSTNYNVASSTSSIDVTVEIPRDGLMSFYKRISCESSWDNAYFYVDGAQVATFTGTSGWGVKEVAVTAGTHNFKWAYTKDSSVNSGEDRFFIDYIDFIHDAQPAQPGWHTYAEGEFDNALGSSIGTSNWAYLYPNGGGYAGMRLTKVALFSDNQYTAVGGNYTCTVYTGGATPAEGTPVSTMTVDVPSNQNAWVEYDLSTPVAVSGNENLWVVWTANTCVSSWPAGMAAGSEVNGTWWEGGNGWELMFDTYGEVWTMKNYFTDRSGRTVEDTYATAETSDMFENHPVQVAPFAQATGSYVENATTVANPNRVAPEKTNDRSFQYFRVYRTDCYNEGPYTPENTVVCCCELHDTLYIDVEWPELAPGVYKWGVGCVYGGNRESEIAWGEPVSVPQEAPAAEATREIIQIGEGLDNDPYCLYPTNTIWGYTMNEQILLASEIGTAGTINSIAYYSSTNSYSYASTVRNVDIYMKHTTKSSFSGLTDWDQVAATDLVYSGNVEFIGANGWTTIELQTPFQYNGTDNLIIAFDDNTGSFQTCTYFGRHNTGDNRGIVVISDTDNYNALSMASYTARELSAQTADIRLDITAGGSGDPIQEERESAIVWSNCLDKDMFLTNGAVDVTVLLNSADSPEGTTVSFRNLNEFEQELYPVAPVVLDSTGYYAWDSFRRGEYEVNVAMDGYESITTEVSIQDATSLRYVLVEILYGIDDLYVSHTGWAMWEGENPGPVPPHGDGDEFTEDFENGLGIFTTIDADGDGYKWRSNTELSGLTGGHNSTNFVLSQSYDNSYGALYPDNYLVSPQVNLVNGSTFSFWACAQDESWASEHFGVFVSDNGTSDWTSVQEWTLTAKGARHDGERGLRQGSWHQYTVDLSAFAGQKYIAVRHFNTTDMYFIDLDDAELTTGAKSDDRHIEGYKVLCTSIDGEPIFSGNTVHPFIQLPTETLIEGERYLCKVAAIYSTGPSAWSQVEWQYRACENYEGMQSLDGETGNDGNEITWTYPNGTPVPPPIGDGDEFTVDFEGGLPTGWNVIDGNNDGATWCLTSAIPTTWTYYASLTLDWYHNGTNAICSGSYINGIGAVNPDEYLVSPQVTLVNGSQLSFWAAATDASYPADHFGVFVSDNGTSDWTSVQEWTLTGKSVNKAGSAASRDGRGLRIGTWYNYTVDLSAYAGQKYIAIRHFNCYDQYIMCVDDIELTAGAKGGRAMWDLMGSMNAHEAAQYGVATDGTNIYTCNWGYSGATYNFCKYDLQGNFIEGFNINGCGTIRDLDYDGQYFYGGANSSTLYCMDLANHTLVSTINTGCGAIRHCSYDPQNDGFWVGGWDDLMLVNRNGQVVTTAPAPTSCGGSGYYEDENGNGHVYLWCEPQSVYDYDINANTINFINNLTNVPGWDGSSTAGGAFVGEYNGKIAFFCDIQQDPNIIGIYELRDGGSPVPPTPVGNFVGAMIFRDGEWLAQVDGNTTSYIDEDEYGSHVTLTWQSGSNWDSECSYIVSYEDGTVILSKGPQGGSFDVSCGYDETYNPVSDLTISVNGYDVTLSWTAPAGAYRYRIARNGITLGETSATNYTDQLHDDMTYTYSVTAIYSGGESMPENLLVEFDWGVNENEAESNFSIYPNPADDVIYINGGNAEFNYSIFNSIGQQVTCGSAKGSQRIDVSSLAKGLYIMKIYNNGNVTTQKIAIR